jgi:hypothetical protein
MSRLPAVLGLVLLALSASACSSQLSESRLPLRALSSDAPSAPRPEPEPSAASETREATQAPLPRIGAPGGSGAGSRCVQPAQSGNDTVGGLPAGIGGVAGPRG